jgi:phosphatidylglycerophosphate synthase
VSIVPRRIASSLRGFLAPAASRLHALGIRANTVTVLGFFLTVVGAVLLATAQPAPAVVVLLLGTLCDSLDGQLARAAGGGTRFGAFLDSTLDRLSDAALAIAAIQLGATLPDAVLYGDGLILLVASFLVSYIRAKAESLGEGASVGIAPREARIALYLLGVAAWAVTGLSSLFAVAVAVAAFLATVTVIQRVAHMASVLDGKKG